MNYAFHPEAEAEFVQAIDYYEECEAGLGYDFAGEVYLAIEPLRVGAARHGRPAGRRRIAGDQKTG